MGRRNNDCSREITEAFIHYPISPQIAPHFSTSASGTVSIRDFQSPEMYITVQSAPTRLTVISTMIHWIRQSINPAPLTEQPWLRQDIPASRRAVRLQLTPPSPSGDVSRNRCKEKSR